MAASRDHPQLLPVVVSVSGDCPQLPPAASVVGGGVGWGGGQVRATTVYRSWWRLQCQPISGGHMPSLRIAYVVEIKFCETQSP